MTKELQPRTEDRPRQDGASPAPASPIPGMDLQTFRNYVTRALSGDMGVPAVVMELVGGSRHAGGEEERERKWFQEFVWRQAIEESLKAINGLIDRYTEMADWHHAQAEKARERMGGALDKIHEIDEFTSGVDDLLKENEKTGMLNREKAIALLQKRGVTVDPNEDDEVLKYKLTQEKERARLERAEWNKQYTDSSDDATFHDAQEKENRRKAEELARQRDATMQNGASPEAAEKLRALEDKASLDVTLKAATMEPPAKADQSAAQDDAAKKTVNHSQDAQTGTEVSDFEALAGSLTSEFASSAAKDQKAAIDISTAISTAAARTAAPGSSIG